MKNTSAMKKSNFKDEILPDFEVLMQFSIWLIRMGRNSAGLMREVMAEACRSCHISAPEEYSKLYPEAIIPKSPFGSPSRRASRLIPYLKGNVGNFLNRRNRFVPDTKSGLLPATVTMNETDDDIVVTKAAADLAAMCQFEMILSYLEGFTNEEIANLVGVQPQAITALLGRSRGILQEEYYEFLCDNNAKGNVADQMAASG